MSPVPHPRVRTVAVSVDVALPLATETVVATLPGLSLDGASQVVRLFGWMLVTTGVGATTVTCRFRRTGLTGTLVGEANAITTPASSTILASHAAEDSPGEVATLPYVLTATAAGVAGTALVAEIIALIR